MIMIRTRGRLRAGARARFLAAVPVYVTGAREAEGCLAFEYSIPAAEPDLVETIERWSSPLAAMQHLISPVTRSFHQVVAECLLAPPEVVTVEIAD